MEKSKGHIEFIGPYEYFQHSDSVYRARIATTYLGTNGYRTGGRCQGPMHMLESILDLVREWHKGE